MNTPADSDIPIVSLDTLKASFLTSAREWRYDRSLFAAARGRFVGPYLMPIIWDHIFADGVIPSVDSLCSSIGSDARPWIFQAHAGAIREVHCALYLAAYGIVTKNSFRDVFFGEDLHFNGQPLAIRHPGAYTLAVWQDRKADKSAACYILDSRSRGAGIHLVTLASLRTLVETQKSLDTRLGSVEALAQA